MPAHPPVRRRQGSTLAGMNAPCAFLHLRESFSVGWLHSRDTSLLALFFCFTTVAPCSPLATIQSSCWCYAAGNQQTVFAFGGHKLSRHDPPTEKYRSPPPAPAASAFFPTSAKRLFNRRVPEDRVNRNSSDALSNARPWSWRFAPNES